MHKRKKNYLCKTYKVQKENYKRVAKSCAIC